MTPLEVVRYAVDPKASQFTVQAFASGLISAVAHSPKIAIRDWTGDATFHPETLADARLRVAAKTGSFEVLDELRENDRREIHRIMYNDVLEIKRFPEVIFESSTIHVNKLRESLFRANIEGKLSLHGITNPHTFFAQVALGVDSFRAHGEFTLLQSDYEMQIASIAGATLRLQDELKFTFYVVGRKKN
jgi:polyisoprenoid-binding protein YceI